jgi:magnesium transporter
VTTSPPADEPETLDAPIEVRPDVAIEALLEGDDVAGAVEYARSLHGAELADALEHLDDDERAQVLSELDTATTAEALDYVEAHFRGDLLAGLSTDQIVETLALEDDDVATDVIQALPDETASEVLEALPEDRREAIDALLVHAEETAGGRMTGQLVTVEADANVDDVLNSLRGAPLDVTQPFYLYVCGADGQLDGVLNLRSLIAARPDTRVDTLMVTDPVSVTIDTDQEEAARVLKQYKLLALPVVDADGRLRGALTADDLLDVLEDEATEDMFRIVGVNEGVDLRSVWRSVGNRLPWLSVNLVTVLAAAWIVSLFQDTLTRVAVLAAFLPVIGGMGGNAGIQTVTVVVRSLALGRLAVGDTVEVIRREVLAGAVVGASTGLAVAFLTLAWQGNPWLGAIVGLALLTNVLVGVTFGVLIPMTLHRLGQDPALSSGIWLTTSTDLLGFLAFLGLASVLISQIE